MSKDLVAIFDYMEREKGIKREIVATAISESLQAAAQKSVEGAANVSVDIDPKSGSIEVYCEKKIVETVSNSTTEIGVEEAKELDPDCEIGQFIDIIVTPANFGRIAAQKARQIITQKLRSAERDVIYEEYRHRVGEIISGTIKRVIRGATLIVDLGKVEAIMPMRNYPKTEKYQVGERVVALLKEVQDTENGGAEVILSRSSPDFVRKLFQQEVPELADGTITIKKIVRDPGYRTKLVVHSEDFKVDPVGACVGVRGVRVKNVVRELNNEKVDIIPHAEDSIDLLQNALSPIEIRKFSISEDGAVVSIIVDDDDFAVVLGRRGMNARLNGELLGVNLEVQKMTDYSRTMELQSLELAESGDPLLEEPIESLEGLISPLVIDSLRSEGYHKLGQILVLSPKKLAEEVDCISPDIAEQIFENINNKRK